MLGQHLEYSIVVEKQIGRGQCNVGNVNSLQANTDNALLDVRSSIVVPAGSPTERNFPRFRRTYPCRTPRSKIWHARGRTDAQIGQELRAIQQQAMVASVTSQVFRELHQYTNRPGLLSSGAKDNDPTLLTCLNLRNQPVLGLQQQLVPCVLTRHHQHVPDFTPRQRGKPHRTAIQTQLDNRTTHIETRFKYTTLTRCS